MLLTYLTSFDKGVIVYFGLCTGALVTSVDIAFPTLLLLLLVVVVVEGGKSFTP